MASQSKTTCANKVSKVDITFTLFLSRGARHSISSKRCPKLAFMSPNDLIHNNRCLFPPRSPVETLDESSPYQKDVKVPHPHLNKSFTFTTPKTYQGARQLFSSVTSLGAQHPRLGTCIGRAQLRVPQQR